MTNVRVGGACGLGLAVALVGGCVGARDRIAAGSPSAAWAAASPSVVAVGTPLDVHADWGGTCWVHKDDGTRAEVDLDRLGPADECEHVTFSTELTCGDACRWRAAGGPYRVTPTRPGVLAVRALLDAGARGTRQFDLPPVEVAMPTQALGRCLTLGQDSQVALALLDGERRLAHDADLRLADGRPCNPEPAPSQPGAARRYTCPATEPALAVTASDDDGANDGSDRRVYELRADLACRLLVPMPELDYPIGPLRFAARSYRTRDELVRASAARLEAWGWDLEPVVRGELASTLRASRADATVQIDVTDARDDGPSVFVWSLQVTRGEAVAASAADDYLAGGAP